MLQKKPGTLQRVFTLKEGGEGGNTFCLFLKIFFFLLFCFFIFGWRWACQIKKKKTPLSVKTDCKCEIGLDFALGKRVFTSCCRSMKQLFHPDDFALLEQRAASDSIPTLSWFGLRLEELRVI
jgi:hypothetical protein